MKSANMFEKYKQEVEDLILLGDYKKAFSFLRDLKNRIENLKPKDLIYGDFLSQYFKDKPGYLEKSVVFFSKEEQLKLEIWINKKLEEVKIYLNNSGSSNQKNSPEDLGLEKFDSLSQSIVLLFELGIIDLIKNRFEKSGVTTNKKIAALIGLIIGIEDSESIENIRKSLSHLENKNSEKNPINKKSKKEVKIRLEKLGLSMERITDLS